jgi:hypothetical protein
MSEDKTRTDVAIAWVGWHLGELTAVSVPLVLAATVSGWFALLALLIAAGWVAHEVAHARSQRGERHAAERRQVRSAPSVGHRVSSTGNGEEGSHEQHLA